MTGNSWTADEIQLIAQRAYDLHLQGKNSDAFEIFAGLVAIDPENVLLPGRLDRAFAGLEPT
jgi:hypothetical protein